MQLRAAVINIFVRWIYRKNYAMHVVVVVVVVHSYLSLGLCLPSYFLLDYSPTTLTNTPLCSNNFHRFTSYKKCQDTEH